MIFFYIWNSGKYNDLNHYSNIAWSFEYFETITNFMVYLRFKSELGAETTKPFRPRGRNDQKRAEFSWGRKVRGRNDLLPLSLALPPQGFETLFFWRFTTDRKGFQITWMASGDYFDFIKIIQYNYIFINIYIFKII